MSLYARRARPKSANLAPEGGVNGSSSHEKMFKWRLSPLETSMRSRRTIVRLLILLSALCIFCFWSSQRFLTLPALESDVRPFVLPDFDVEDVKKTTASYASNPLQSPYKGQFWEAGQRLRTATHWLSSSDRLNGRASSQYDLSQAIEAVAMNMVPFLTNKNGQPFQDLRSSFMPNSRGIVISVGGRNDAVRSAGHLITSLRAVFRCELPIEIAYAGDDDLSSSERDSIAALEAATNVSFLDVLTVFDDAKLRLAEGHWAVKPFAALASSFEQVIVMDADAVFLKDPNVLFEQQAFKAHGAYLFHDRLLWQRAFAERHDWLKDQIKEPSSELTGSLFWTEDYAEECDAGVVVLDKSRPEVLMGLLHTAWQKTYEVREEVTYRLMHGDKESWWLGLEFAGAGYGFETHYASILGWELPCEADSDDDCVCSFTTAHLDDQEELLWFNGSGLKNKIADSEEYEVPEAWMKDGRWKKGARKQDMSCMTGAPIKPLNKLERKTLELNIEVAMSVDDFLEKLNRH